MRWTHEEIEYLKLNYPIKRANEIVLNRTQKSIYCMANILNLKSPNKPCSKETAIKIGLANKNKKRTMETKIKMSQIRKGNHLSRTEFKKGHIPWAKGKTGIYNQETLNKMSVAASRRIGKKNPNYGKHTLSISGKMRGVKNPRWKGGISNTSTLIRQSLKYKEWRKQCHKKDRFICQKCGQLGRGNLEAHHKIPFKLLLKKAQINFPLLNLYDATMIYTPMWDVNNGMTLCRECHKETRKGVYYN